MYRQIMSLADTTITESVTLGEEDTVATPPKEDIFYDDDDISEVTFDGDSVCEIWDDDIEIIDLTMDDDIEVVVVDSDETIRDCKRRRTIK